jgi:signal transduction histidine kinase
MSHHSLTPVFTGLRTGLHLLVASLLALVVARIAMGEAASTGLALLLAALFAAAYASGAWVARAGARRRALFGALWLLALTALWVALLTMIPEAAYLVFPLFFLYLHLLRSPGGPAAVVVATAVAVIALGLDSGFTVAGVVGPLVGAGVALLIGLGYQALAREAAEREALLVELVATRSQLAATEREQGILTERSRLAREIHDTVAQGLSSIQMLLYAAERAEPDSPAADHVRLARNTAADVLHETRRFIRELTPPALDQGLPSALRRLAAAKTSASPVEVVVDAPDRVDLSMDAQTALLRVAQGALANVVQHAHASRARVLVTEEEGRVVMSVSDDGVGFDPAAVRAASSSADSFGLRAIGDRIDQIGGSFELETEPGSGTTVRVAVGRSGS